MTIFTVKEWMNNQVVFIDPDATVIEGLTLMRHRYANSLIVNKTSTSKEYGIVTSIDICDKIVAQKNDPSKTKIRDIMACPVITVPANMRITECAAKMKEFRIHQLPVADEKGNIIGIISATDFLVIAEAAGKQFKERSLR